MSGVKVPDVRASGADAKQKGIPPVLEARMFDLNGERGLGDVVCSGRSEQLLEVALRSAGQLRLVLDLRIELVRCFPEDPQRSLPTSMVPHTGSHGSPRPGDSQHLSEPRDRVRHEVNHQLRQRRVEHSTVKRQLLCRSTLDSQSGIAGGDCRGKTIRGIDRAHSFGRKPPDQLARQRPRTAANVEHMLTRSDARKFCEPRRQRRRLPAHEPIVLLSTDAEAHHASL